MKQIKETEKITTIVLEDGDILNICKIGKIKKMIRIVSNANTLHFINIANPKQKEIKKESDPLPKI